MPGDGEHFGFGLLDGNLRLQMAHDPEIATVALLALLGGKGHGHPGFGAQGIVETFGHDANDGEGLTVHLHVAAKNFWVGGVAALPKSVAENQFMIFSRLTLFG